MQFVRVSRGLSFCAILRGRNLSAKFAPCDLRVRTKKRRSSRPATIVTELNERLCSFVVFVIELWWRCVKLVSVSACIKLKTCIMYSI